MTLILNGSVGVSDVDGSAATPAIRGTDANTGMFFPAADTIAFAEGGVESMRITSAGDVGIGTTTPNAASGYTNVTLNNTAGGIYDINVSGTLASRWYANSTGAFLGSNTSVPLIFNTVGTERARITSDGNLLVGMTSPLSTERFSVSGGGANVAVIQQSTNTSGFHVLRCGLQQNGNNTSSYFLHGNTNNVGNWFLYGNGTTSFSSDERLKKNIETTRDGYLEDVSKLRVVKYNWRNDEEGKPRELGLIAQEVEQVFPGLVQDDIEKISPNDDTVYKTVKQSVLPFILLKAIQELKAQNDELKARVEALEIK